MNNKKNTNKILISTDIGSDCDDALAILASLNSGLDIRGIHTVNGDVKTRAYIARHIVELSGRDTPVYIGEKNPIWSPSEPYTNHEDFYVDNRYIDEEASEGSRDLVYVNPSSVGIREDSVKGLEKALNEEPHEVFSIGPMTNLAKLLLNNYGIRERILRLYVMGCRFSNGGELGHNVRYDVDAARIMFGSDIPITIIPGDLCNKWRMPVKYLDGLKSPAGLYVKRMAESHLGIRTSNALNSTRISDISPALNKRILEDSEFIKSIRIEEVRDSNFPSLSATIYRLASILPLPDGNYRISLSELDREIKEAQEMIAKFNGKHFTDCDAAFDPDKFFREYFAIIKRFREREPVGIRFGDLFATMLEDIIPKDVSVSDLYVPFCYKHPESIKTEKGNVVIDDMGATKRVKGDRLDIVTAVNIPKFEKFIEENIN